MGGPGSAVLYRRMVGAGCRLAVTAGTDCLLSFSCCSTFSNPAVWARVYANVEGPLSVESFQEAVGRVRTMATNGPWLELAVAGRGPGETVAAEAGERLAVEVSLRGPGAERLRLVTADGVLATAEVRGEHCRLAAELISVRRATLWPRRQAGLTPTCLLGRPSLTPARSGWTWTAATWHADGTPSSAWTGSTAWRTWPGVPAGSARPASWTTCRRYWSRPGPSTGAWRSRGTEGPGVLHLGPMMASGTAQDVSPPSLPVRAWAVDEGMGDKRARRIAVGASAPEGGPPRVARPRGSVTSPARSSCGWPRRRAGSPGAEASTKTPMALGSCLGRAFVAPATSPRAAPARRALPSSLVAPTPCEGSASQALSHHAGAKAARSVGVALSLVSRRRRTVRPTQLSIATRRLWGWLRPRSLSG